MRCHGWQESLGERRAVPVGGGSREQKTKGRKRLAFLTLCWQWLTPLQRGKREKNRNKLFQYKKKPQPINFKTITIKTNTKLKCSYYYHWLVASKELFVLLKINIRHKPNQTKWRHKLNDKQLWALQVRQVTNNTTKNKKGVWRNA